MPRDKRERLTAAAVELSHHVGLSNASLATIAERANVPVGNVYYYFKTKDDIAGAVVDVRREQYAELRQRWEEATDDPTERVISFVHHTRHAVDDLTAHGCPIGGLCLDLAQVNPELGSVAGEIFTDTIDWVSTQLSLAGSATPDQAARRIVALLQGATLLAHASRDGDLLMSECAQLERDLREQPPPESR